MRGKERQDQCGPLSTRPGYIQNSVEISNTNTSFGYLSYCDIFCSDFAGFGNIYIQTRWQWTERIKHIKHMYIKQKHIIDCVFFFFSDDVSRTQSDFKKKQKMAEKN